MTSPNALFCTFAGLQPFCDGDDFLESKAERFQRTLWSLGLEGVQEMRAVIDSLLVATRELGEAMSKRIENEIHKSIYEAIERDMARDILYGSPTYTHRIRNKE